MFDPKAPNTVTQELLCHRDSSMAVYLFLTPHKNTINVQSSLKGRGQKASGFNYLCLPALPYKKYCLSLKTKLVLQTWSNY